MKEYQSKCWQEFRSEVIELDGGRCRHCRRPQDEVVLQVHHRKYIPARLPWQYAYEDCETLCKGCHAAEHGITPPKTGWQYLGYEDLGQVSANCELCGSNFRYQFFIYHKDWGSMQVGTHCCNALTGSDLASSQVDKQNKFDERKRRFIRSKRWLNISGREILRQKGIRIEITETDGRYFIQLDQFPGQKSFDTLKAAKSHVFDIIEDGSAQNFLTRRGDIHDARPQRKSIRLKSYDYTKTGLYFVTICAWQQKCIFGQIDNRKMHLNTVGEIVNQQWCDLTNHYPAIELHSHVIMPNHLHAIIEVADDAGAINLAPTVGDIVRGFKARCTRVVNASISGLKLWQRNYYEHIIRDEPSYLQILEYIENNPAKWAEDGYYIDPDGRHLRRPLM